MRAKDLTKQGKTQCNQQQRHKGLGERNAGTIVGDYYESCYKDLKWVTIQSAAEVTCACWMGDEVPPREGIHRTHAKYAKIDV